jgi:hypothetical protein
MLAGVTLGWGLSTMYFYRQILQLKDDIRVTRDHLGRCADPINKHSNKFNDIETVLNNFQKSLENFTGHNTGIEDLIEGQQEMHNYLVDSISAIVKTLADKDIKVVVPAPPRISYVLGKKKKIKQKKKQKKVVKYDSSSDSSDDSDSDESVEKQVSRFKKK